MDNDIERIANAIANELLRQEPPKGGTYFVDADDLNETIIDGRFNLREVAFAVRSVMRQPA